MFKNLLYHEVGLILLPLTGDESRLEAIALHRAQFLRMALRGEANDAIGDVEDRLGGTIVGFERDHRRAGKLGGKIENVAYLGGAETVNALRIVTHDGKVAIERAHAMKNRGLQPVGVLLVVHEDVIEPFVQESDERLVAKEMKPIEKEIVVIEHMAFLLCFGIRFET